MSSLLKQLHALCYTNDFENFKMLAKYIPDIDERYEGKTLLYSACYTGNIDITRYLLENGADPNITSFGSTNLYIAVWYDYLNIVTLLLTNSKKKAKIDESNYGTIFSPLCYAIEREHTNIVKVLVNCGANVNYNVYGKNIRPLHLACYKRNFEIIKALIELGANINSLDNHSRSPMYYIINKYSYSYTREPSDDLIEFLEGSGARIIDSTHVSKLKSVVALNPNAAEWVQKA